MPSRSHNDPFDLFDETFQSLLSELEPGLDRELDRLRGKPAPTTKPKPAPTTKPQPARPTVHPPKLFVYTPDDALPQQWLWPGRIPLAALTLLDAAPGCGASLFALTLAACVSGGSPLPDGAPSTKGPVLVIAPHDSPCRTLVPRLLAAGADLSNVSFLATPRPPSTSPSSDPPAPHPFFSLPQDLDYLRNIINARKPSLVILDPLVAIPG